MNPAYLHRAFARALFCTLVVAAFAGPARADCPQGSHWVSSAVLSDLLGVNPALQVNSESAELSIGPRLFNLSSSAEIQSTVSGAVTMTGDAVLKAKGRYRLTTRRSKHFIKITAVQADLFTTRLFINGELASTNDYRDVFFGDREIEYRCRRGKLTLIQQVGSHSRILKFQ